MDTNGRPARRWGGWLGSLVALVVVLVLACGTSAPPAQQVTGTPRPAGTPVPTVAAQATPAPTAVRPAKNRAVIITEAEPGSVGRWSQGCSGEIHSMGCREFTVDDINWIDTKTSQVVALSGIDSWQQIAPDRWRYKIREGVKFHNGEPFDAEAAKVAMDYNGISTNPGTGYSYTGLTTGEVVDALTFDVKCGQPCPIFPRTGIFTGFQAPKWYASASEEERSRLTVGFGPYRIVGYQPGVETRFEIYEGYKPNTAYDAQAPTIKNITHVFRAENLVRASMVATAEADWAADIGFEHIDRVPQAKQSTTTEVYTLVLDAMWHPELKKQKVRLALAHGIDCPGLLNSMFGGRIKCHAAIAPAASVGITPENSKPREYNPELAKRLLREAGYDPKNEINVNTRPGSNVRGLEIMEAVVTHWRSVGVSSKLNAWGDLQKAREVQLSGCGNFLNEAGYKEKLDCAQRAIPGPYFASSHAYEVATSDEILDMQRQGNARLSCFGRSSRVCFPELEKKIETASGTPEGPERTRLMQEIADIAYNEVYFIPFFEVQMVYGLSKDLVWEPYYAPRLRGNTMRFK